MRPIPKSYAVPSGRVVAAVIVERLRDETKITVQQVESACDMAKYAAARSAGTEALSHPSTEQTMDG